MTDTSIYTRTGRSVPVLRLLVRSLFLLLALALAWPSPPVGAAAPQDAGFTREVRKLAEAGDAEAQFALAQLLDLGTGPAQDREEAITWLRKAADQNLAAACYTLGLKYEFGTTVEKDLSQAEALYRAAALQDLPMAQYRLGLLYLEEGLPSQPVVAFAWLSLAAEHGYPDAAASQSRSAALLTEEERGQALRMRDELRRQIGQRRK